MAEKRQGQQKKCKSGNLWKYINTMRTKAQGSDEHCKTHVFDTHTRRMTGQSEMLLKEEGDTEVI